MQWQEARLQVSKHLICIWIIHNDKHANRRKILQLANAFAAAAAVAAVAAAQIRENTAASTTPRLL